MDTFSIARRPRPKTGAAFGYFKITKKLKTGIYKKAVKGFLFFRSINHRLTSINDLVGKTEAIVTVPFASVAVIIH